MGLSIRLTADFLSKIMKSIRWQEEKCNVAKENKSNNIVLSDSILQKKDKWGQNRNKVCQSTFVVDKYWRLKYDETKQQFSIICRNKENWQT